jgi:hypothetical protein
MGNQNIKKITHFLPTVLTVVVSPRWWIQFGIIFMTLCLPFTHLTAQEMVRKPAVAGYFYPKDKE